MKTWFLIFAMALTATPTLAQNYGRNSPQVKSVLNKMTLEMAKDFTVLCQKEGVPNACNLLGLAYEFGTRKAVQPHPGLAFTFYSRACELGHEIACQNATLMFVQQDSEEFFERHLEKHLQNSLRGCKQQHVICCHQVSVFLIGAALAAKKDQKIDQCLQSLETAEEIMKGVCTKPQIEEAETELCQAYFQMEVPQCVMTL